MYIWAASHATRTQAGWEQVARNATMQDTGYHNGCRHLLHDRDPKFIRGFRETLAPGGMMYLPLLARSPNLNAYAERWVRSIKEECLSKLILFEFLEHYHGERNQQGKNNVLLFPAPAPLEPGRRPGIHCRERLDGFLRHYSRI